MDLEILIICKPKVLFFLNKLQNTFLIMSSKYFHSKEDEKTQLIKITRNNFFNRITQVL